MRSEVDFDPRVELEADSVARLFAANGCDPTWFAGKRCLDLAATDSRLANALKSLGAGTVTRCYFFGTEADTATRAGEHLVAERHPGARWLSDSTHSEHIAAECDLDGISTNWQLPYEDGAFDFIAVGSALNCFTQRDLVLTEVARMVRLGGRVFLDLNELRGLRLTAMRRLSASVRQLDHATVRAAVNSLHLTKRSHANVIRMLTPQSSRSINASDVRRDLERAGFRNIEHWTDVPDDDDRQVAELRSDLERLRDVFHAVRIAPTLSRGESIGFETPARSLASACRLAIHDVTELITRLDSIEMTYVAGQLPRSVRQQELLGDAPLRLMARP